MRYYIADAMNQSLSATARLFGSVKSVTESRFNPIREKKLGRAKNALLETSIRILRHYPKRGWDYPDVKIKERLFPVNETVVIDKPFCRLMKFQRTGLSKSAPKVLFVAAMSGHHATLSRETFREFLPDHEVYVTDWTDARMVPLKEGRFGFKEYIAYVLEFINEIGPNTHFVGLCQAGVPVLAAAAILSAQGSDCKPASMSFLASPMDIRVNPGLLTKISGIINLRLVTAVALHKVPSRYPGRGRLVYPGMVQLGNFMSLSIRSHVESHVQYAKDIYHGNLEDADKFRDFYNEYFSLLDSAAEFYLETLENVFINQTLPKGLLTFQGEKVDCADITDIPIFTVEGKKDNMVTKGQCQAAADLCSNLPDELKESYIEEGVGHYGIFSGSGFREGIAPKVKDFIARHNKVQKQMVVQS